MRIQLRAGSGSKSTSKKPMLPMSPVLRAVLAAPAIDQVDQRIADALDRRDVQFPGPAWSVEAPGAQLHRAFVGACGVVHAKRDRADARAVQPREALRERVRLGVDDEVDLALAVQRDVLVAMARDRP